MKLSAFEAGVEVVIKFGLSMCFFTSFLFLETICDWHVTYYVILGQLLRKCVNGKKEKALIALIVLIQTGIFGKIRSKTYLVRIG